MFVTGVRFSYAALKGDVMPSIYEMKHSPEVEKVLEDMRKLIGKEFGVTLVGNRLTLRWYVDKQLVSVHMIIEEVKTPSEAEENMAKHERYQKFFEKYKKKFPGLSGELYYCEEGESLK